jgi:hypothetical protein
VAWQELGLGGGLCLVHDVFVCLVIEPKKPIAIICRSVWVEWQQGVAPITWNGLLVLIVSN